MAQVGGAADPSAGGPGSAGPASVQEVVVVANRTPEPLQTVGQSVTLITLPEIRRTQTVIVSDLLARTPGVSFSRNGGPGEATQVRIRGAEADQTVVLIDGVKLNDPASTGGGFNFANLLTGDVTQIEVLRGPQSTLYGSQAIGGVVNIITAEPFKTLGGDLQLEAGDYATGYGKVGVGGKSGPLSWRLAGSYYTTDGVSAFDRNVFTAAGERRRGVVGGLESDGYHNGGLTARATYAFSPDVALDLRVYYASARNQFDGFPPPRFAFADDLEFGRTRELVDYTGLNLKLLDGRLKNRVALQYTDIQRENVNPEQKVTTRTFDAEGENLRGEYQGVLTLRPGYTAVFGAEHEEQRFTTVSPSASTPNPAPVRGDATIDSGYGQLQAEVIPNLNLTGGVRYDEHSTFGGATTGQASAAWALNGGATVLRASYGRGFKAPALFQLYSQFGNLGLVPEEANGWDAGVEQKLWNGRARVQATWFGRDTSNLITFVSCFGVATAACKLQPGGYYNNIARTEAQGLELSGTVRPIENLELAANYTFTDARDRSPGAVTNGRELARRSRDTANLSGTYVWPFELSTGIAVRYAGRSFDNAANTTRLKSYVLVDLRAAYPLGPGLELYGRVENVTDEAYETIFRYGALGRAAYAGVRLSF